MTKPGHDMTREDVALLGYAQQMIEAGHRVTIEKDDRGELVASIEIKVRASHFQRRNRNAWPDYLLPWFLDKSELQP